MVEVSGSAKDLILRSVLPRDSLDWKGKGKNPVAKANALLLQIQILRSAGNQRKVTSFNIRWVV
ncbi:hypothetical protein DI243_10410 [Paenibacillus polymyxa]|nr:hypothetical protein RE92_01575 [Paenibacillus polymyxa]QOH61801.1 hypothetical protein DI243_10410 [Paenibacillus polymyxa]